MLFGLASLEAGLGALADDGGRELLRSLELEPGEGIFGHAIATGDVFVTGDYLADDSFVHAAGSDAFVQRLDVHSMIAAPLIDGAARAGSERPVLSPIEGMEVGHVREGDDVLASVILECLAGEPNGFGYGLFGNPLTPFQSNSFPGHSCTDLLQHVCNQDPGSPERGLTVTHGWVGNNMPTDHARFGFGGH